MTRRRSMVALAALQLLACRATPDHHPYPRAVAEMITSDELVAVVGGTQNAYSALEQLRPLFLSTRPGARDLRGEAPRIQVFINGYIAGDVEILRTIPLASVESIRRVQGTAAFTQLGGIRAGDVVLLVRLR